MRQVVLVLVREHDKVLMARRKAYPHHWGLPGGKVEAGELQEEGLIRELREETGLSGETGKLVSSGEDSGFRVLVYEVSVKGELCPGVGEAEASCGTWDDLTGGEGAFPEFNANLQRSLYDYS